MSAVDSARGVPSSFGSFLLCVEGNEPAHIKAVTAELVAGDITLDAAGVQVVTDGVGAVGALIGAGPFALPAQYERAAGSRVDADCDSPGDRVDLALQVSRGAGEGAVRGVLVDYSVGLEEYRLRIPITVKLCVNEPPVAERLPECR